MRVVIRNGIGAKELVPPPAGANTDSFCRGPINAGAPTQRSPHLATPAAARGSEHVEFLGLLPQHEFQRARQQTVNYALARLISVRDGVVLGQFEICPP